MTVLSRTLLLAAICVPCLHAQTVILQQTGFPTIDSEAIPAPILTDAFGSAATLVDVQRLRAADTLGGAKLLILPYGSAFPAEAWPAILRYLERGGNLLFVGGQPLHVPVIQSSAGGFAPQSPQTGYSKVIDFRHSYPVPLDGSPTAFHWRPGYTFMPALAVKADRIFAQEGRLQGLGYLDAADGTHVASPIIVADHPAGSKMAGSRIVALPFSPAPGFWASADGIRLLRAAAHYAQAGSASLQIESQYSTLRPGELPELTLHLRRAAKAPTAGTVEAKMLQGDRVLDRASITIDAGRHDAPIPFRKPMPTGLYTVQATWTPAGASAPQEFAENGFQVQELSTLEAGDALGVSGDFLTLGAKPFFPVGANYFTTEENGWDFSGPRNAAVWERDFADMQRHGVNFVRTGVWIAAGRFVEPITGAVNERFLRNLEAFLAAAQRHRIAVNFTFFAFTPRVADQRRNDGDSVPPQNPYLDPAALESEKGYVSSVVARFGKIPWLSYDLINEPSFSNPNLVFHGNVPNGDPTELAAWRAWLQKRYTTLPALAEAWRTTEPQLSAWSAIPLPRQADLTYNRYGNEQQVRAFDYNLFAQDMFSNWVRNMVDIIHGCGSRQLIDVGQDEGGVTNRLLNQFYATAGVSFTTNHTYWQDDALLWDSVAAKRPGMPNITGETGYQPAWNPDGAWRYDELTGTAIEERKWALGFAAGSSGAMQWDWAREVDFGIERSDGSAKIWEPMMRDLGHFAEQAAPYATGLTLPEVAIVLPQSLQLSTHNADAIKAQQTAVRVLYHHNRVEAYAVGEYQMDTLGHPRLILLPSPYGLSESAWSEIAVRVREGAILLISGPFDADEHLHPTAFAKQLGLDATLAPLQLRDDLLKLPTGNVPLVYKGLATTTLDRVTLPNDQTFAALPLGKGRILISAFPLELNDDLDSVARVYDYALTAAHITHTYTTPVTNPGILICPTILPHATLYVLSSETETAPVSFTDRRSGKLFSGSLEAGRAAILLVGEHGDILANYHWKPVPITARP